MLDVPAPLLGLRVLLVEDEPLIALMLEDYVQDLGCRFFQTATSVVAAREILENIVPDVVILDITLRSYEPDFSLADELSERQIPFVFCSGNHNSIVPARHRARPFLSKPFGSEDIVDALVRCHLSPTTDSLNRPARDEPRRDFPDHP